MLRMIGRGVEGPQAGRRRAAGGPQAGACMVDDRMKKNCVGYNVCLVGGRGGKRRKVVTLVKEEEEERTCALLIAASYSNFENG